MFRPLKKKVRERMVVYLLNRAFKNARTHVSLTYERRYCRDKPYIVEFLFNKGCAMI